MSIITTKAEEVLRHVIIPHECEHNAPGTNPRHICSWTAEGDKGGKIRLKGSKCRKGGTEISLPDFIKWVESYIEFYKENGLFDKGQANKARKLLEELANS